jgi:hypothetical protein
MTVQNHSSPTVITANWQPFEKRAPWSYISAREAAQLLGISPQSVHNKVGRWQLPPLEKKPGFRGNKKFFQICKLKSFLEGRPEEEIYSEWISQTFPGEKMNLAQAQFTVKHCYKILGLERP